MGKNRKILGGKETVMKSFESLVTVTARSAMRDNSQIQKVISRIVPAQTLAQIEFCRLEGGRLRITVTSAAWIARLRFIERQLIGELRAVKRDVHTVSYHVSPEQRPAARKTQRSARKSSSGAASVFGAAECIDEGACAADAEVPDRNDDEPDPLKQQLLELAKKLGQA